MYRKAISDIMLVMLLIGLLMLAFDIRILKAEPRMIIVPDDYLTIQEAVDAANNGDTIYVRRGWYYERVNVTKTVNVVGECREETIVRGGFYINAMDVLLCNFTITAPRNYCVEIHGYNVTIRSNIITNSLWGVFLSTNSCKCTVTENIIEKCQDGIFSLANYGFHSIIHNNVTSCDDAGIGLLDEGNNFIYNNIITECCFCGIGLCFSSNNIIEKNIVYRNNIGICLVHSNNNAIYHNNFWDNTIQVELEDSVNFWDDGYPSGGNYWSDYTGVDLFSGPYQNETGGDGIGDTPYVIDENNVDRYPLMKPWIPVVTAIDPDTLNLKSKGKWITAYIELPEGYNVNDIDVLTIMLNDTVSVDLSAPVAIGDYDNDTVRDLMVCFNWTEVAEYILSKGIVFGNITIEVSGKLYDGTVFIGTDMVLVSSLIGDVNIDGKVDMKDLYTAALSFGFYPAWNPNTDINGDNIINLLDLYLIAANFGKQA